MDIPRENIGFIFDKFYYINAMVRISNEELVSILMKNGRESFQSIAKRLGVSDTAIRKKIKKLEDDGTIRSFGVDIDPFKLGYDILALIGIDTLPDRYIHVIEEVKGFEGVKKLWRSSGDHMIMLEVWLKDTRSLTAFTKNIESIQGVTKTCPAIIHERIL